MVISHFKLLVNYWKFASNTCCSLVFWRTVFFCAHVGDGRAEWRVCIDHIWRVERSWLQEEMGFVNARRLRYLSDFTKQRHWLLCMCVGLNSHFFKCHNNTPWNGVAWFQSYVSHSDVIIITAGPCVVVWVQVLQTVLQTMLEYNRSSVPWSYWLYWLLISLS